MSRDDRSGEFVAVLILFVSICTIVLALRCYCKLAIVKSFAIDDCLSIFTLVGLPSGKSEINPAHLLRSSSAIDIFPWFLYFGILDRRKWYREKEISDR